MGSIRKDGLVWHWYSKRIAWEDIFLRWQVAWMIKRQSKIFFCSKYFWNASCFGVKMFFTQIKGSPLNLKNSYFSFSLLSLSLSLNPHSLSHSLSLDHTHTLISIKDAMFWILLKISNFFLIIFASSSSLF